MRVLVLLALLVLAGCGTDSSSTASDPAGDSTDGGASGAAMPSAVPAAPGEVRTRSVVTIMDNGRPEVCLGPVAESWPPQCSGPPLLGWDWKQQRLRVGQPGQLGGPSGTTRQSFEQQGPVRWGQYLLTGLWDGTSLTVRTAIPAALYDGPPSEPPPPPTPAREYSEDELTAISDELMGRLPGALSAFVQGGGVLLDVVYDDGSLQGWADRQYGRNVVVVTSALLDAP